MAYQGPLAQCCDMTAIKVLAGAGVLQGSAGRRSICKIALVTVGRIEFLVCCWTEGFNFTDCWPEATLCTLLDGLFRRAAPSMAASCVRVHQKSRGESANKIQVTVFCNGILEVTSHHFGHFLFIQAGH